MSTEPTTPAPAPQAAGLSTTQRHSIRDGVCHATMLGFGENFLVPFGIFLHASFLQIGFLSTLPQLLAALGQTAGVWFIEHFRDRRRALARAVKVNAVIWIPIGLVALFSVQWNSAVYALLLLSAVYFASGGFIAPIWTSLIGDVVPAAARGRFFGVRNSFVAIATFFSVIVAGQILQFGRNSGLEHVGFVAVFCLAAAARFGSGHFLERYDNPPYVFHPQQRFTFFQFLRRLPWSNFAKFTLFTATINFGVAFAAPYFAVYMLRDLQLTYPQFTTLSAVMTLTQFLTMAYWGQLADRFGNKKILNIAGVLICIAPLLWLVSHRFEYLIFIQAYSGFVWAGYNLAAGNFIFDAVTPPKLPRCAAYYALVNAIGFFLGSILGGYTARHVDDVLVWLSVDWRPFSPLLVVFAISGLLRMVAVAFLVRRFKEVRQVEPIRHRELLFMVVNVRPIAGATFDVVFSRFLTRRKDGSPRPKR